MYTFPWSFPCWENPQYIALSQRHLMGFPHLYYLHWNDILRNSLLGVLFLIWNICYHFSWNCNLPLPLWTFAIFTLKRHLTEFPWCIISYMEHLLSFFVELWPSPPCELCIACNETSRNLLFFMIVYLTHFLIVPQLFRVKKRIVYLLYSTIDLFTILTPFLSFVVFTMY